jgi:cold shock CspA family protein
MSNCILEQQGVLNIQGCKLFKDIVVSILIMSGVVSETHVNNNSLNNIGVVKWFNNKSGYGFVTIISEGDMHESDVFVHHSSISVKDEQYKYLVQGEYVSLSVEKSDKKDFVFQTTKVTGVYGGALMCETRQDIRTQRVDRVKDMDDFQETYTKKRRNPKTNFHTLTAIQPPLLQRHPSTQPSTDL